MVDAILYCFVAVIVGIAVVVTGVVYCVSLV
jgi:hypothetical protein